MAVTKILARKGRLDVGVRYVLNGDKTDDCILTAHFNCDPGREYRQMMQTKRETHRTDGRQCYHIIQSFRPGEITPELALEIAKEFVREHLDGFEAVIGTHALISEGVEFANLRLTITDEQHRFGVRQRTTLEGKGDAPHVMVMSATPIPRTLSLVLYGDLDLSAVDEMPPGRTPVRTRIVPEEKREGLYAFIRAQAAQGRQTYVVCPLVGEAELDDAALRSAAQEQKELAQALAPLKVGLVHGRMNKAQKEDTLAAFYAGTLDVLVATTVIEVGVNVPNATVMVIEGAERFGLAQLHQLRGRVGRGAQESWCFLMAEPNERLKTLVSTNDGFVVAQKDLELRGAGEFFGTRQHGEPQMPALMLTGDVRLLERTRQTFLQISRQAAYRDEYRAVLEAANRRFARSGQFLARN